MSSRFLMLGEIGDPLAVPPAAGASGAGLYFLALGSYGKPPLGAERVPLMHLNTDDVEFGGAGARVVYRRLFLEVGYEQGACAVRITPRVDFLDLPATALEFPAQGRRVIEPIEIAMARTGTYFGFRFEVLLCAGPVDMMKAAVAFRPLAAASRVGPSS